MWYALVLISYMNVTVLDIDMTQEYVSRKECRQVTHKYLKDIQATMLEYSNVIEEKTRPPILKYRCKKIPFRKV